jgi:AraC family transcriptional regulator
MPQPASSNGPAAFDVRQTHGILWRPEHHIERASDRLGWSSLYVSQQREGAYHAAFAAVEDHLVILHLDGPVAVERRLGGRPARSLVGPGGLFVMPGGHDFWVHLTQPLASLHLYVRDRILREVARDLYPGDPDRIAVAPGLGETDPVVESLARAAGHAIAEEDAGSGLLADHVARALAARLLARGIGPPRVAAGDATAAVLGPARRRRLREFVDTHLAYPIGLADLAAAVGLTPTRLARGFKRDMGTTPYHYVLLARITRARHLLRTTDRPIADIAAGCGFSHQEHLTRMFRREHGTTPAAYRRLTRS